jgi:uncharacterized protein (TIGR03000 family)
MRGHRFVWVAGAALWAIGGFGAIASAAPPGRMMPRPAPVQQHMNPGMMPGQDWWKIYPWSAYNAWRNPYWYPPYNTNYPFAPNQAYPYYPSYGMYPATGPGYTPGPEGNAAPGIEVEQARKEALLPRPTGPIKEAPRDAGVIEVRLTDSFGPVVFDGAKVSSVGTTRYYVTPVLPLGKELSVTVSAVVNRGGQSTMEERQIQVAAGRITLVDFTRPARGPVSR